MAKQAIQGISGSITLPTGHNGRIRAWSMTKTQDVNDCTGFSSAGAQECLGGVTRASFTASGYLEFNDTGAAPGTDVIDDSAVPGTGGTGAGAVTLTATSGCTFVGNVVVSSLSIGTGIDGNATFAITGTFSGTVEETWDESSA